MVLFAPSGSLIWRAAARPEGRASFRTPYGPPHSPRRRREEAQGERNSLDLPHLPGPYVLVGGEYDAQRVDRVLDVLAEIDLAADRLEEQALLAFTELLMARFFRGRFELVGMREGAVGFEPRMVKTQCDGAGVAVVVS